MEQIIKYVLGEAREILEAPFIFFSALLVVLCAAWWAINWRYSAIIDTKDGIIALYKERLQGATPDQARAKIESLEAQVLSLKAREWPPLTLRTSAAFKAALKDLSPTRIDVFAQDRDGVLLVQTLIVALNELGWGAKRSSSMNPLPEGLTVWPDNEAGRQMRDALAAATGFSLTDDEYIKRENRIAIGLGFKVD